MDSSDERSSRQTRKEEPYFNTLSYVLSRFAFVGIHLDFTLWLIYVFNDPLNFKAFAPFKIPTLDFDKNQIKSQATCTPLIMENLWNNVFFFALWWITHSGLARNVTKKALGLYEHPIERPLFGTIAIFMWFLTMYTWKPITNCTRWEVTETSKTTLIISGTIIMLGSLLVIALLWTLPDHLFGTEKHKYRQGQFPPHKVIKGTFPYGLVRHPGSTGLLWCFWALPSYTPNHILLASLWTIFIVIGTLQFEEKGILNDKTEFGREYAEYRKEVWAFFPNFKSILTVLGLRKYKQGQKQT
jgi:protein-S-isoprenylcysteine O-methyltransferase Ste14